MTDAAAPPLLAAPPRPAKPLAPLAFLRAAGSDTLSMFDEAAYDELVVVRRYGPVVVAFVSDPAGVRHVLVDRWQDYERVPAVRRLYREEVGTGTIASSGALWRRHRRISGSVLDSRALAPELAGLATIAEAHADALAARAGERLNMEPVVGACWVEGLNRVSTGGDARALPILRWLSRVPRKPRPMDLIPVPDWLKERLSPARQSAERAALRGALGDLVALRRTEAYDGPRDLLWRLAHGADRDTGERLPPDEVRDEAAGILSAGDTTIRALTWIWYLLALHPQVEARVHAEVDAAADEGPLGPEHLRRLPYLRQVLDEVLRLYPSVPVIPRRARRSHVIGGRRVPRGAIVLVAPWVIHRHRKLWSEPEVFDPDRFSEARRGERPAFAHIPFGAGPGVCIGSHFATTQMLLIVAALARRLRFVLDPDTPVAPFGAISLHPRGGLWMTPTPRGVGVQV